MGKVHVNANGLSVVHKDSDGVATATLPDVCKTQIGNTVVPIPYSNVAYSKDLKKGSKNVKINGNSIAIQGSEFSKSTGDDAGRLGGVMSGTNKDKATWLSCSFTVEIEGKGVCRLTDKMMMNNGNTACLAGIVQEPVAGVAAKDKKKTNPGTLIVKAVNICNNDPIAGAEACADRRVAKTDNSGSARLEKLPPENYSVRVKKSYPDLDYLTFISHYPKMTRSHKAESEARVGVQLGEGETKQVEAKLEVFRLVNKVVFKRKYIHPTGEDKYGHWWVEIDDKESYGWWPKHQLGSDDNAKSPEPQEPKPLPDGAGAVEKVGYLFNRACYSIDSLAYSAREHSATQTLRGVEGVLNNGRSLDPHHNDDGEDEFQAVIHDCRTDNESKQNIRNFAHSYANDYGANWSWRFETFGNNNCHTFQKEMMKKCKLEEVKDLLEGK